MSRKYYKYYECPVGVIEICTTDEELLSILYVEEKKNNSEDIDFIKKVEKQLDEYFKGKRTEFDIQYRLQGTPFQEQVWTSLTDIKYGETASYKDVAIKIGNEKAVRAIGNANSRNIINIVVPCHRVIGSNKSLTGYGGGLHRKSWLLEHESNLK